MRTQCACYAPGQRNSKQTRSFAKATIEMLGSQQVERHSEFI